MADAKPRCRLYLQLPEPLTAKLEAQFAQMMANADAACVLLCRDDEPIDEIHADRLLDLAQSAGLACLIENDIELAERLGADGVHIEADAALYASARDRLGEGANIGVGCGLNRHDAMLLAEMGADYVAFGPEGANDIDLVDQRTELITWWSEIFVVPCIAWNIDNADEAAQLARLGADFIAPSKRIWQADDAVSIIADINSAISRVRRAA